MKNDFFRRSSSDGAWFKIKAFSNEHRFLSHLVTERRQHGTVKPCYVRAALRRSVADIRGKTASYTFDLITLNHFENQEQGYFTYVFC